MTEVDEVNLVKGTERASTRRAVTQIGCSIPTTRIAAATDSLESVQP